MSDFPSTASAALEWRGTDLATSGSGTKQSYLRQKRAFDVVFAIAALLAFSPILLLVTLAIKLTSRGPAFFRQARTGLGGKEFIVTKFRSMVDGAHARREDLAPLSDLDGPLFKMRRDPRLTPIGRFLRKTSLDELPQLWHVLVGDMSVVGPRPHATYEAERYAGQHPIRFNVRPGLTCLWQVEGRSLLDFETSMRLDAEYVARMCWALDLWILLRTIPAVLTGRGAM